MVKCFKKQNSGIEIILKFVIKNVFLPLTVLSQTDDINLKFILIVSAVWIIIYLNMTPKTAVFKNLTGLTGF